MQTVYLLLTDGFEEIEALTPVDILRRGGVQVHTVGLTGKTVTGSHNITVTADIDGKAFTLPEDAAMVVLPGGPGTKSLKESDIVASVLEDAHQRGLYIGAICAAPTVLHKYGLLRGKTATAFPASQPELTDTNVTGDAVEVDGKIITARSAGVALQFSHALLRCITTGENADEVLASVYP